MKNNQLFKYSGCWYQLLVLATLLSVTTKLAAQEVKVVRDLRLWTGASIEKSVGKGWTLSLGEEIRFKHNISEVNNYFTEAGVRYRISSNFALEGGYRFTRDKKSDNSFENLSRYNLDLRYRGRLDFITFYYRLRYQKEVEGFNLFDQKIDYEKYVRHRIRIRYNDFQRIKPFVSAEIFQLFRPYHDSEFEYIRVLGGFKYEPGKLGSFGLAYGFNRDFATMAPAMIYLFKIDYTYQF